MTQRKTTVTTTMRTTTTTREKKTKTTRAGRTKTKNQPRKPTASNLRQRVMIRKTTKSHQMRMTKTKTNLRKIPRKDPQKRTQMKERRLINQPLDKSARMLLQSQTEPLQNVQNPTLVPPVFSWAISLGMLMKNGWRGLLSLLAAFPERVLSQTAIRVARRVSDTLISSPPNLLKKHWSSMVTK
jgi:hypothetical protein